jgi:hypothetical protein
MKALNQKGIGHVAGVVLVLVVLAVGAVGYRVYQNSTQSSESTTLTSNPVSVPDKFKTTADLKKADRALDNSGIDGSVDPNSLNQDLSFLL